MDIFNIVKNYVYTVILVAVGMGCAAHNYLLLGGACFALAGLTATMAAICFQLQIMK